MPLGFSWGTTRCAIKYGDSAAGMYTSPKVSLHLKKQFHLVILDRNHENPFQDRMPDWGPCCFFSQNFATFELVKTPLRPSGCEWIFGPWHLQETWEHSQDLGFLQGLRRILAAGNCRSKWWILVDIGGYWWILVDIGGSWRIRPSFNINTLQEFGIQNSSRGWGTTVPKRHVMYDGCLKIGDIDGYQIPYFVVIEWGTWFLKHGNWAFRILSGWCLVPWCRERAVSEFQ